jgi:hypothetical protein
MVYYIQLQMDPMMIGKLQNLFLSFADVFILGHYCFLKCLNVSLL